MLEYILVAGVVVVSVIGFALVYRGGMNTAQSALNGAVTSTLSGTAN